MLTTDGNCPYQALYRRVPRLLVDFGKAAGAALDDEAGGLACVSRHSQRLREVSLDSAVQTIAQRRIDRAVQDKTRPALETLDLDVGDQVDFLLGRNDKGHLRMGRTRRGYDAEQCPRKSCEF